MLEEHVFEAQLGDQKIILKTGKIARLAGGAIIAQCGDTVLLATATLSGSPREGIDFFPLTVDFEERLYAAGRIPGSFFRREGRPSEKAILTSRLIDRPIRPLFPSDMRNDVQVIVQTLSQGDQEHSDTLGIIAASAALTISDVPFDGPVAGVRIGYIDGKLVVNPTISQMTTSTLDLRIAGSADAIIMVEAGSNEIPESVMLDAIELAHQSIQGVINLQNEMRAAVGKPKADYPSFAMPPALTSRVRDLMLERVNRLVETTEHARLRLGVGDEVFGVFHRHRRRDGSGKGQRHQLGHGREVHRGVVACLVQRRVDRRGRRVRHQRVPVGRGVEQGRHGDQAVAAGLVLDDDGLSEPLGQAIGHQA